MGFASKNEEEIRQMIFFFVKKNIWRTQQLNFFLYCEQIV
jgi:hypothetical protein